MEPALAPVRLGYMQPAPLTQIALWPVILRRPARRRLAAVLVSVTLLLVSALVPPRPAGLGSPHARGTLSQLHRLAVEATNSPVAGAISHQAADDAILAALVLLAAALAALLGARRRFDSLAGRGALARRSRGPPTGR